jgi:hypothetical protein
MSWTSQKRRRIEVGLMSRNSKFFQWFAEYAVEVIWTLDNMFSWHDLQHCEPCFPTAVCLECSENHICTPYVLQSIFYVYWHSLMENSRVRLEGCPQVHHLVLRFLLRPHLEVASVVLVPFHVVVCTKGTPCESFLYSHIDCNSCDIFAVVHLCKSSYV